MNEITPPYVTLPYQSGSAGPTGKYSYKVETWSAYFEFEDKTTFPGTGDLYTLNFSFETQWFDMNGTIEEIILSFDATYDDFFWNLFGGYLYPLMIRVEIFLEGIRQPLYSEKFSLKKGEKLHVKNIGVFSDRKTKIRYTLCEIEINAKLTITFYKTTVKYSKGEPDTPVIIIPVQPKSIDSGISIVDYPTSAYPNTYVPIKAACWHDLKGENAELIVNMYQDGKLIGTFTYNIEGGYKYYFEKHVKIPSSGTTKIRYTVTPGYQFKETNENNNISEITIIVLESSDNGGTGGGGTGGGGTGDGGTGGGGTGNEKEYGTILVEIDGPEDRLKDTVIYYDSQATVAKGRITPIDVELYRLYRVTCSQKGFIFIPSEELVYLTKKVNSVTVKFKMIDLNLLLLGAGGIAGFLILLVVIILFLRRK